MLRDQGISYGGYIEQITYLLSLKMDYERVDTVNQVGQELTRLNIQPTLIERPGLPVSIIVNRDLALWPYQPMFFNRGTSR